MKPNFIGKSLFKIVPLRFRKAGRVILVAHERLTEPRGTIE